MTLTTSSIKAVAQGNGATTVWPFTFLIPTLTDLVVTLVNVASGNETIVNPVNYSVSGLGNVGGGSVTYPLSGSPLTSATKIVVERFVPNLQQTDLTNQGGAYPADIEDALDYLTMITQQLQDQINRSVLFSVSETITVTLPTATARAGLYFAFDAFGNPIAVAGLNPSVTVSSAMIPVVTAASTAAALTALGIPGSLLDALIPSGTCWDYDAGGAAPAGFVYPIGQACTPLYPDYRAKLISAGSPYGTNGIDPLMPDRRSFASAGKSNMGGVDNGLLPGGTVLGAVLGVYQSNLAANQIPSLTSVNPVQSITVNSVSGVGDYVKTEAGLLDVQTATGTPNSRVLNGATGSVGIASVSGTTSNSISVTYTNGALQPYSRVQPTFICNKILKVH